MIPWSRVRRPARWFAAGAVIATGCHGKPVALPAGHLPAPSAVPDFQTAGRLTQVGYGHVKPGDRPRLELHGSLPGAASPPIIPPKFDPKSPAAEREKAVRDVYPKSNVLPASGVVELPADGRGLTLTDLQQIAAENSPVLRRATADAEAVYGSVIQAGLHPNPTIGYQVDAWQPGLPRPQNVTGSGAGQQGGYISQLIKTAGKLTLAQKVAGFDYLNAIVAVRRAQVDTAAKVRTQYFAVLVSHQSVEVYRALAELADEVYAIELRQVAAGEAAPYEPLQVYAQAEQARNAVTLAEQNYRAAWKQLAAAVGRPDLPISPLIGRADTAAPQFDADPILARMLEQHTEILTARNTVTQAEVNHVLQRRMPVPDLVTYSYHEYDNLSQEYQLGMQIGVQLPIADRNQGNIRQAAAKIARAHEDLKATQNDLLGRFAEAFARYEANRAIAERYREKILPNLTRAYRAIVKRSQVEPEKVSFNDVVVAQQNLGQALQNYLTALDSQWKAVVDVANLGQLDELYSALPLANPAEIAPPPKK